MFTKPDAQQWENHQAKSGQGSWVLLRNGIDPNKDGAANLAQTVQRAMCGLIGLHWCGPDQGWE